ncbi:unnamed protein product [Amoebophrya sp. A120]|nr:unnamed protein product [Amoebophrya sp. A120]|eukprot:GSA120T00001438001.1
MVDSSEKKFGSTNLVVYPPSGYQAPGYLPLDPPSLAKCCSFRPGPCSVQPVPFGMNEVAFSSGNLLVFQNLETEEQRFFRSQAEILCVAFSREEPATSSRGSSAPSRPGTGKPSPKLGAFGEKAVAVPGTTRVEGDIVLFSPLMSSGNNLITPKRRLKFHKGDVVQLKFLLSSKLLISFANDKAMTGALWSLAGVSGPASSSLSPLRTFSQGPADLCRQIVLLPDLEADSAIRFCTHGPQHLKFWSVSKINPGSSSTFKVKRGCFSNSSAAAAASNKGSFSVTAACWFGDPQNPTIAAGTDKGELFLFHDPSGSGSAVRIVPATTSRFGRTVVNDEFYRPDSAIVSLVCQTTGTSFAAQQLVALSEHGALLIFNVVAAKATGPAAAVGGAVPLGSRPTSSAMNTTANASAALMRSPLFPSSAPSSSKLRTVPTPMQRGASAASAASTRKTLTATLLSNTGVAFEDCFYTYASALAITSVQSMNLWSMGLDQAGPVAPLTSAVPALSADTLFVTSTASVFQCPFPRAPSQVLSLENDSYMEQYPETNKDPASFQALISQPANSTFTCATAFEDLVFLGSADDGVSVFRLSETTNKLDFEMSLLPGVGISSLVASAWGLAVAAGGRLVLYKNYRYTDTPFFDRTVVSPNGSTANSSVNKPSLKDGITCSTFGHGAKFAFGTKAGAVYYLDLDESPVRPRILRGHSSEIVGVSFLQPGNVVLTASTKQLLAFDPVMMRRLASLRECKELTAVGSSALPYGFGTQGAWDPVKSYAPNRKFLAFDDLLVATNGKRFDLYPHPAVDGDSGAPAMAVHGGPIIDVCSLGAGQFLTVSKDTVAMWQASPPEVAAGGQSRLVAGEDVEMLQPSASSFASTSQVAQRAIAQENARAAAELREQEMPASPKANLEYQIADLQEQVGNIAERLDFAANLVGEVDYSPSGGGMAMEVEQPDDDVQMMGGITGFGFQPQGRSTEAEDPNAEGRRERRLRSEKAKDTLATKVGADSGFQPKLLDGNSAAGMLCVDKVSTDFRVRGIAKRSFYAVEVACRCPITSGTKKGSQTIVFTSVTGDTTEVEVPAGYDLQKAIVPELEFPSGKCRFAVPLMPRTEGDSFYVLPLGTKPKVVAAAS